MSTTDTRPGRVTDIVVWAVKALKAHEPLVSEANGYGAKVTDGPPQLGDLNHPVVVSVQAIFQGSDNKRDGEENRLLVQNSIEVSDDWFGREGYAEMTAIMDEVGHVMKHATSNRFAYEGVYGGSQALQTEGTSYLMAERWLFRSKSE